MSGDRAMEAAVAGARADLAALTRALAARIVGQDEACHGVIDALLTGGHVLLEGVPGLGKTSLVRALAEAVGLAFARVQFTPDLMPSDVTGTDILSDEGERRAFVFQAGPLFANVVLADEINRGTPKTQSALLEAMQEGTVTIAGKTHALPVPFYVLATQNPIEMEGTYPLPEAQLDRFLVKLRMTQPTAIEMHAILDRSTARQDSAMAPVLSRERLTLLRQLVREIPTARPVQDFIVRAVAATHPARSPVDEIRRFVRYGSSPRGAQAVLLGAKVRALRDGRVTPSFDDARRALAPALRHRVLLNFEGEAEGVSTDALIERIGREVPEL